MSGRLGRVPLAAFAFLVYLFLFAPIVIVVGNALNADSSLSTWGGVTTRWFEQMFKDEVVIEGIRNSLVIASIATVVATALGTLAAIGLQRSGRLLATTTNASTYSRLLMPELVLAIGLLLAFQAVAWPLGLATVIIGHVAFYTAYVIMIVAARLSRRDPSVEDAARDLGATPIRALVRVTLPEAMPAILVSALLVFAFSMDNVITSLFLSSGLNTLPLVLFSLIRTRITPEVNAIATFMIAVSAFVILLGFAVYWLRGELRRRRATRPRGARS